jgi:hypothetical protein
MMILKLLLLSLIGCTFGFELEGIEFPTKKSESFNITIRQGLFNFNSGFTICVRFIEAYILNIQGESTPYISQNS